MTRLFATLSLLLSGCPGGTTTTDTSDTGSTGGPGVDPGPDTGTAFLSWHGTLKYDPETESLTATRGIGANTLTDSTYICDIVASYVSTGNGARGCPDCEYSFTTQLVEGGTRGDQCRRFLAPTIFDYYDYSDFYFGTNLDGLGWSDEYIYVYASTEYALTDIVWGHVNGAGNNGWFLYGYNLPSSGNFNVVGDKYEATFSRPVVTQYGTLQYYYFYY